MITLINYNLATVYHVKEFISFLNDLDKNGFYETHFQEVLKNNIKMYEKFSIVVSFVLSPHHYYIDDMKMDKIKNIVSFLNKKYEFGNYKLLDNDVENKIYEELHEVEKAKFTLSLNALNGENNISEFLKNDYKVNLSKINVSKTSN